jgi:hypothetical protein
MFSLLAVLVKPVVPTQGCFGLVRFRLTVSVVDLDRLIIIH